MNIDKDTILGLLRGDGRHTEADQAASELPDQVDTDTHAGLLDKFGINPADLIARFTGGGNTAGQGGADGQNGIGGLLGKIL